MQIFDRLQRDTVFKSGLIKGTGRLPLQRSIELHDGMEPEDMQGSLHL